jgi:hypothetical protein
MASDGFFASKAWAVESVVAGRYDADMVNAFKNIEVLQNENLSEMCNLASRKEK